jgi:hypothetical protein
MSDDARDQLVYALHRLDEARQTQQREIIALRAQLAALVDVLVGRQLLNEGHKRHLARVAKHSTGGDRKVRLRLYVDKYRIPGPDIDCAALYHLCKARCCRMTIELTEDDVEEGKLRWKLDEPYLLRKDDDGQCTHIDRATGGCTAYHHRPATCREYDCREDKRVWIDYAKRIPAPMPVSLDPFQS